MPKPTRTRIRAQSGDSLPRRERERLTRRLEIVEAACNVFSEKGFERATLDEIAEQAEYGKGTLYNYFKNKEDLFAASMQRVFEVFREIAIDACSENLTTRECFAEYTRRAVAYYRDHYALCHLVMMEFLRQEQEGGDVRARKRDQIDLMMTPLVARLRKGMKDGEIRRGDAKTLTALFVGLVDHFYLHLTREQLPTTDREMSRQVDMLMTIYFDGIAARGKDGRI
ncbi:MAG: TetR/AcrR family transcriptional regulator [Candidatus Zixiibacteriota bacterium]